MRDFKGHYPIGVVRTCNGSGMSVAQQRNVLKVNGVVNIWRLGIQALEDVELAFERLDSDGEPVPAVLVTVFPAVVGKDRRAIFKMLLKHKQALYDLELDRFINLNEGTADSILYEERCHKQRADHARGQVKNPGRKSALSDDDWKEAAIDWCDPEKAQINNDDIAGTYGVTGPAFNARFGPRRQCLADGKVRT